MSTVAQAVSRAVDDYAPRIGKWMQDHLGNMSKEFNLDHPQYGVIDKELSSRAAEYQRIHQVELGKADAPLAEMRKQLSGDSTISDLYKRNNTLAQIHAKLVTRNHPLQNQSAILMGRSPANAGKTIEQLSFKTSAEARLIAKRQAFGMHNEYITPLFYDLYNMGKKDPKVISHADSLANMFSLLTHDMSEFRVKGGERKGYRSQTKADIERYTTKVNKLTGGDTPKPKDLKYIYEPPTPAEVKTSRLIHQQVAPWIAIPHIGTMVNLASAPLGSMTKGLMALSDDTFRDHLAKTGILASTMHSIMDTSIRWETGNTANMIGHQAANIIGKILHNPGFQRVRLTQLMFGGAVGHFALQEWAEKAVTGSRRAIAELEQAHIDSSAVIARGGKLTPDELETGIYHYVNDRFFIDKTLQRSLYSTANKWVRTATTFHAFVSYQSSFIKDELSKLIRTGDWLSVAQYAGTLGVLFPAVAPMMKSAEMLLRTASPEQALQSLKDDYKQMLNPQDYTAKQNLYKYVELMSYLGAYGVYTRYLQAIEGHRLQAQILGPLIGTGSTTLQDLGTGAIGTKRGKHNMAPFYRDVLRYGVPVFGGPLEHQLLPPKKRGRR